MNVSKGSEWEPERGPVEKHRSPVGSRSNFIKCEESSFSFHDYVCGPPLRWLCKFLYSPSWFERSHTHLRGDIWREFNEAPSTNNINTLYSKLKFLAQMSEFPFFFISGWTSFIIRKKIFISETRSSWHLKTLVEMDGTEGKSRVDENTIRWDHRFST